MISLLIDDIIKNALIEISDLNPKNSDDIRNFDNTVINFSDKVHKDIQILRSFLNDQIWRNQKLEKHRVFSKKILFCLFDNYLLNNKIYFSDFLQKSNSLGYKDNNKQRKISDQIANMTDNEAQLIFKSLKKN